MEKNAFISMFRSKFKKQNTHNKFMVFTKYEIFNNEPFYNSLAFVRNFIVPYSLFKWIKNHIASNVYMHGEIFEMAEAWADQFIRTQQEGFQTQLTKSK